MTRRWLAVLAAAAVAACGGPPEPGVAAETPLPVTGAVTLEAHLERPRYLAARQMLEVVFRNPGRSPVRLQQVELRAPRFATVPATRRDTVVEPGRRVDVPIAYGDARCPAPPDLPGVREEVVVQIRGRDGEREEARLPLPDPDPVLDRLHEEECRERAVAEAVDVGFGSSWTRGSAPGDPAIRGSVVLRRRASDQTVALVDIGGSVIFSIRAGTAGTSPLARMDAASPSLEVPVEIDVSGCHPHALTESKKTFQFPVWVRLGNGPEQHLTIEPEGRGRRLLEDLLADCAPVG